MELEKKSISGHGGAREGSGRPKGSTQKITAKDILSTAHSIIGKSLVVSILEGYRDTIINNDTKGRQVYEKMLLDKTAASMLDVEVEDTTNLLQAKHLAFAEAIKAINTINNIKDDQDASD